MICDNEITLLISATYCILVDESFPDLLVWQCTRTPHYHHSPPTTPVPFYIHTFIFYVQVQALLKHQYKSHTQSHVFMVHSFFKVLVLYLDTTVDGEDYFLSGSDKEVVIQMEKHKGYNQLIDS